MIESILYNVGIYCRLSLDDGSVGESGSIQTQNQIILTKYCKDNNFNVYKIYVDDGYSGLNYNRPAFDEMLGDIELGKINIVITKDLSRKVKLAKRSRALDGLFISAQTPFGYIKDPNNKNHLVVDEEAKEIVIKIYNLAKQGLGTYRIAKLLNEERVITSSRYKFQKRGYQICKI